MAYSIGLDLGTSSVKAVLFSESCGIVEKATAEFEYKKSQLGDGSEYLGIELEKFYHTVTGGIRSIVEKTPSGAEISGIAMASASGNIVLCDERGAALIDGYSWLNRDFTAEIESVFGKEFGKDVGSVAGWGLAPSFPLGQLSHLACHEKELLSRAKTVCMTTEYLLHRLTAVWGIDVSSATPSYLLNQKERRWNESYLSALGISEAKLPKIYESGALLGKINETGAADTGLALGTKVYLGSFDHPTAARASGVLGEGDLLISCGTSWVCFFPVNDREKIVKNGFLCDPFLSPKGPWGAMVSLARASERIKSVVEKYIDDSEDKFKILDECAARAESYEPDFNPFEEDGDFYDYSKEKIAKALMLGVARALKACLKNTVEIKHISMCGGPSGSKMWQKILSEVFESQVSVSFGAYTGAAGAALYALK